VAVESEPKILKLEKPRFPDFAYAQGLEGQVVVQVEIDKDGIPRQSRILKSTNPLLEPPIIEAVNKSQFTPARMTAGPVAAWMTIPFRFKLKR
jgi:protein TonB